MKGSILVLAMVAGMVLPGMMRSDVEAARPVGVWGDTDCSGFVGPEDVENVKRALNELEPVLQVPCTPNRAAAPTDINCSGAMEAADLVLIKRLAMGLPLVNVPEGCPPAGWVD